MKANPERTGIRQATRMDAAAITRLVNVAFKVERFFLVRDRTTLEKVLENMKKGTYLLAEDGSGLIGCVYVELRGERAYFGVLSVEPSRQGEGLGRMLVEKAESSARASGCRVMHLRIVNLRAELPAFYHRLGYRETGTEPFSGDEVPSQPCHFVNMSKPLV